MDSRILPFPLEATGPEDGPDADFTTPPEAMVEWVSLLDLLNPEQHGLGMREIAEVEAFCSYVTIGFSSASFVVRAHDGRRFHLQGAIDEDVGPEITAVSVVCMPEGERLPFPPAENDPTTHWSAETEPFNAELERLRASGADDAVLHRA
jgi:hypothetical protein